VSVTLSNILFQSMDIYTIVKNHLANSLANSGDVITLFYNGLFKSEQKYMVLLAFGIVTFVALVFLRFLIELCFGIYAGFRLKKIDPEGWERFKGYKRNSVYKKWLKGLYNPDDIYCKLYKKYDRFGNLCFVIWLIMFLLVAVAVIVSDIGAK